MNEARGRLLHVFSVGISGAIGIRMLFLDDYRKLPGEGHCFTPVRCIEICIASAKK